MRQAPEVDPTKANESLVHCMIDHEAQQRWRVLIRSVLHEVGMTNWGTVAVDRIVFFVSDKTPSQLRETAPKDLKKVLDTAHQNSLRAVAKALREDLSQRLAVDPAPPRELFVKVQNPQPSQQQQQPNTSEAQLSKQSARPFRGLDAHAAAFTPQHLLPHPCAATPPPPG